MVELGATRPPHISGSFRAGSPGQNATDRFQLLFEQAAVGIEQLDLEGRIINANAAVCAILGYEREDLIGRSVAEITDPDDLPGEQTLLGQLLRGEISSYRFEK